MNVLFEEYDGRRVCISCCGDVWLIYFVVFWEEVCVKNDERRGDKFFRE